MSELGPTHHVGIVVEDLSVASELFAGALRLPITRELVLPNGGRALFLGHGQVQVELVSLGNSAARQARLQGARARLDHLAFAVPDVAAAVRTLRGRGVAMQTSEPIEPAGRPTIFTEASSTSDVVLQLLQA